MKEFKIIFDPLQIKNAALYLERNNSLCKQSADYWEDDIYKTIKRWLAKPNVCSSGTGGYNVIFSEELDTIYVNVYIDPSVGKERDFTKAVYASGKIIKEF